MSQCRSGQARPRSGLTNVTRGKHSSRDSQTTLTIEQVAELPLRHPGRVPDLRHPDRTGEAILKRFNSRRVALYCHQIERPAALGHQERAVAVTAQRHAREAGGGFDVGVMVPLRRLVERGKADGVLRGDAPTAWLAEALVALTCSVAAALPALGRDDAVAAITDLFLSGARARPSVV